jgi:hypothetical protein
MFFKILKLFTTTRVRSPLLIYNTFWREEADGKERVVCLWREVPRAITGRVAGTRYWTRVLHCCNRGTGTAWTFPPPVQPRVQPIWPYHWDHRFTRVLSTSSLSQWVRCAFSEQSDGRFKEHRCNSKAAGVCKPDALFNKLVHKFHSHSTTYHLYTRRRFMNIFNNMTHLVSVPFCPYPTGKSLKTDTRKNLSGCWLEYHRHELPRRSHPKA